MSLRRKILPADNTLHETEGFNLISAYQQPKVIDKALKKECEMGCILGPFESLPIPNFSSSGLGLVPKQDGGWLTIYHLSAPPNSSINSLINPDDYSLP